MSRRLRLLLAAGGAALALAAGCASPDDPTEVRTPKGMCPAEDSCTADYVDGEWIIRPDYSQ